MRPFTLISLTAFHSNCIIFAYSLRSRVILERPSKNKKSKELPPLAEVKIVVSGPVSVFLVKELEVTTRLPLYYLPHGEYTLQLRANPIAQGKKTEMWWMLTFNGVEYGMAVSGWRQSEYVTILE